MILNGRHGFFRRDRNALSVALRITQAKYFFKARGEYDQGLCVIIYIQKNNLYHKKTAARPAAALRSPQLTVIGVGLRKISSKFCLPSVRAARRHCRCLAFRLFYFILHLFSVYTFLIRNPSRMSNGLRMRRAIF